MFIVDISLRDVIPILEKDEMSCEGATITSGCIEIEGIWDLEVNGNIVLSNVSEQDIQEYLERGTNLIEKEREVCCAMYYRPIPLVGIFSNEGWENGQTIYIPIALIPDGPSITSPITLNAIPNPSGEIDWYGLGENFSEQLNAQLEPYGLDSIWTNNFKEFGVTAANSNPEKNQIKEFYILNEGNSISSDFIKRGLYPLVCLAPS